MKFLQLVERILWATQMDSLISPASWTRRGHSDDFDPWITSHRRNARTQRTHEEAHPANV